MPLVILLLPGMNKYLSTPPDVHGSRAQVIDQYPQPSTEAAITPKSRKT